MLSDYSNTKFYKDEKYAINSLFAGVISRFDTN